MSTELQQYKFLIKETVNFLEEFSSFYLWEEYQSDNTHIVEFLSEMPFFL